MISVVNYTLLVLAALACFGLYNVSYETQRADDELQRVHEEVANEQAKIAALEADWAVLNRLQSLQMRSTRYLGLRPVARSQMMSLEEAMARLPIDRPADSVAASTFPRPRARPDARRP